MVLWKRVGATVLGNHRQSLLLLLHISRCYRLCISDSWIVIWAFAQETLARAQCIPFREPHSASTLATMVTHCTGSVERFRQKKHANDAIILVLMLSCDLELTHRHSYTKTTLPLCLSVLPRFNEQPSKQIVFTLIVNLCVCLLPTIQPSPKPLLRKSANRPSFAQGKEENHNALFW